MRLKSYKKDNIELQIQFEKLIFIFVSLVLAIPSIGYLITNKTVLDFKEWFTFFLMSPKSHYESIMGAIIFGLILIILFICYFKIVKKSDTQFKGLKQIVFFVLILAIIFAIMLPFTTSDIFYYMGTGWIDSNYNENPYYTTVSEVRLNNPEDEILQRTGVWEEQVVVYGPTWAFICKILSFLSFGNVTLSLYIYKIAGIIVHVLNTILVYKITKKKKFSILYGANPFILFEMITNVHNDIYMIFFILLALYFLLKKKNIILTLVFMAIATCVKYVAVLLIPFLVLYYLKDKTIPKKLLYCLLYAIIFLAVIFICYLPYARDIKLPLIMFMQQQKYRESILAIALEISNNTKMKILTPLKETFMAIFAAIYFLTLISVLTKKDIKITSILRNCNNILLFFLFLIITNLCPWYTSWLTPLLFWQRGKMAKNIIYLQFSYELVTLINFALATESYKIGLMYLPIMAILIIIFNNINSWRNYGQACFNRWKQHNK